MLKLLNKSNVAINSIAAAKNRKLPTNLFNPRTLISAINGNKMTVKMMSTTTTSTTSSSSTSSVDEKEMKNFRELSSSWWIEDGGEFEALHRMNKLRVPLIRDAMVAYRQSLSASDREAIDTYGGGEAGIPKLTYTSEQLRVQPLLGLNILDVGCGGGILSEPLARLGAHVTGIDACKENISVAQLRAETQYEKSNGSLEFYERIRYFNCSLEDLALVEENFNYFDAVVMSEVVEHVNNLNEFLTNSTKLLKNHGYSFITTINRTNRSYFLAILAAEYLLNLVPRGTHTWDKFVKPDEIKSVLEKNQVFVKFNMGMHYNPFTKNWSWSTDDSTNYAMYAQKFQTTER